MSLPSPRMKDFESTAVARADFPEEIVHHDGFLGWGLVGFVVAFGVIALFFIYRRGYMQAMRHGAHAIEENLRSLRKPVTKAARAKPDELLEKVRGASDAFDERFAHTFALSAALNKHTKGLRTAVDGMKPAESKADKGGAVAPGATVTGSTVISINVGGPGAAEATPAPPPEPVIEDQPISLWKAVQRLFEELHSRNALAVALKGAQDQLLFSPRWEKPRPESGRRED